MIRINLASSRGMLSGAGMGGVGEGTSIGIVTEQVRKEALTKLLIMLLVPTALFVYEQQNIPTIRAQLSQKQNALTELQTFNAKAENAVQEIKKFKEDEKKIQARIAVLEKLAKDRFREVKVLDLFQQVIPEKVWLNRVDVKEGRILLSGFSISDMDISTFMESLSKSVFLQDVVLVSSSEQVLENATLKKFEVSCILDKVAAGGEQ